MPIDPMLKLSLLWAVALVVAFPVLSLVLTEWILRLRRGRRAVAAPVAQLRNFILPALAALVLLRKVMVWSDSDNSVRIATTLTWLFVVNAALSLLNVLLFSGAREGTWQARVPRLFIDMIRVMIVLLCGAIVLSTVWGQDLGQLFGALGIGSLVLGLALQEPVGNLFSGIMLMMERPLAVGDWVRFNDYVGQVIETTWRSVHIRSDAEDLVIVPNSALATESFTNFSRPNRIHLESVTLRFSYDDPPNTVKQVLSETAKRTRGVVVDDVRVYLAAFGTAGIEYEVELPVDDYERVWDVLEEFHTLVWYAAKRNSLTIPFPTQTQIMVPSAELGAMREAALPREVLAAFPRFGLDHEGAAAAVGRRAVQNYAKGECVVAEGQQLSGLHLILSGRVSLSTRDPAGAAVTIATLSRGEFFGESALLSNAPSDVTVTALDDLEMLVLNNDLLNGLLERAPHLSHEIGEVMEYRRKSLRHARARHPSAAPGAAVSS